MVGLDPKGVDARGSRDNGAAPVTSPVKGMVAVVAPQVWVASILQSEWYRLDFLCYLKRADGTTRWVDLEADGAQHTQEREQDMRRQRGIPARRLGYRAYQLTSRTFGHTLLAAFTAQLDEAEWRPHARAS